MQKGSGERNAGGESITKKTGRKTELKIRRLFVIASIVETSHYAYWEVALHYTVFSVLINPTKN